MKTRDALRQADDSQVLVLQITLGQLKTIRADAVVRQGRLQQVVRTEAEGQNWEIHDAAVKEAEKSYQIGKWADQLLMSLSPERMEDEWKSLPGGLITLRGYYEEDPFYRVNE